MVIFTSVPFSPTLKTICYEDKIWFSCPDLLRIMRRSAMNAWEKANLSEYIKTISYIKASGKTGTQKFITTFGLTKLLTHADDSYITKWFTDTVFPALNSEPEKKVTPAARPEDPFAEKWDEIKAKHPLHKFMTYKNSTLGTLRATKKNGEAWFSADDIFYILHIRFPKNVIGKLPAAGKKVMNFGRTFSSVLMLNETGVKSTAEFATFSLGEDLMGWLNSTVIPSINKEPDSSFDLPAVKDRNTLLEKRLEEARAKAKVVDMISNSESCFYIGELAKLLKQNGYDIGQRQLFERLREEGYLCKDKAHWNHPTQKAMKQNLFHISVRPYVAWNGASTTNSTVRVTGKGVVYFLDKYIGTAAGKEAA